MKKYLILTVLLLIGVATNSSAITYQGSITSSQGGGMYGVGDWDDGGATLSWEVDNTTNTDLWTYVYNWTGTIKELSHIDIQVSNTFTEENIKPGTTSEYELGNYTTGDSSNPGIPADLYGLKWDTTGDALSYTVTIVTDRMPMWGNFYAKDGKTGGNDIIAYNTGFLSTTDASIGDGNAMIGNLAWVLVPDTENGGGGGGGNNPIPEPSTLILMGAGLLGLGLVQRMKR